MGATQQFSLRWNNYVQHITCAFDSLRTDEDLVDVTLSCEGKKIYAHKMLLSACSIYFKEVFKDNPCKHPVIIFRNVKYEDLLAIIDFMYHGEVNVEQAQLSSFLTTAEMLAVQGLSVGSTPPRGDTRKRQPVLVESEPVSPMPDTSRPTSVKLPSRPLGTQNPPGPAVSPKSPRPVTPTRKRRLSPPSKPNNVEKEVMSKRRQPEVFAPKIEAEEPDEDGSFGEEDAMMDVSQLEFTPEDADSPVIKQEEPLSPEGMSEKLSHLEQQKQGQAGTSANLETAGDESTEEVEYLEDEADWESEEGETAYVMMGEDGEFEFVNIDVKNPEETALVKEARKERGMTEYVLEREAEEQEEVTGADGTEAVQYIYAEGVSDNNEIIIGEPPKYSCPDCAQSFKRLDSLHKHSNVHAGRTECPVCGAIFSRITHRTRHMKTKHPDWPITAIKRGRRSRKP